MLMWGQRDLRIRIAQAAGRDSTEEENESQIAKLEQLDKRYDQLTPEEREYPDLRQRDLLEVFGSRGTASEVVKGERAISKAEAQKLAALFHVPADLFL